MRRSMMLAALVTSVMLLGPPLATAQTPGVTATEIKIGTFGPLTGANYLFGKLVMNGVEVVYNEVNRPAASTAGSSRWSARTTGAIRRPPSRR